MMFQSLRLSDLPGESIDTLRAPSSTRPAIWVVEENGRKAVVKDYSVNGFFYRNVIGRFLVWRENKAYRRLRGLEGVPAFYRVIDGLALVVEKIPGRDLEGLQKETSLSGDFFEDLKAVVERVHRRGLAHCDLKRAPNIFLGDDGKAYILDWSAAISEREFRFFPANRIYKRFLLDDFNAVIKAKLRHCPDKISAEEKRRYERRSKGEELLRAVRDKLRELLKLIA
jgi:RIO-like serine/threonine protein kinase